MIITALSDIHGQLINDIKSGDILCICGDIFPQSVERNIAASKDWFIFKFLNWIKQLDYRIILLVPGNHDFYLEYIGRKVNEVIKESGLSNRLKVLCDDRIEYQGYVFYGTPWVSNLKRWAYNSLNPQDVYSRIPTDCDILLTHHAPKIDTLGCSFPGTPNEKDFGSIELAEAIRSINGLKYHFCGHIHTGNHEGVRINNAISYNVSLMDEEYNVRFPVRIVEI